MKLVICKHHFSFDAACMRSLLLCYYYYYYVTKSKQTSEMKIRKFVGSTEMKSIAIVMAIAILLQAL